jgi:hypothetical protein
MIKNMTGMGHVVVSNGSSSGPYVSGSTGQTMVGMVRYHNNDLQVYDGNSWLTISGGYTTIDLSGTANAAISWAMAKMEEERKLDELCKKYPGLGKARDNYEVFKRLVKAEEDLSESVQSN